MGTSVRVVCCDPTTWRSSDYCCCSSCCLLFASWRLTAGGGVGGDERQAICVRGVVTSRSSSIADERVASTCRRSNIVRLQTVGLPFAHPNKDQRYCQSHAETMFKKLCNKRQGCSVNSVQFDNQYLNMGCEKSNRCLKVNYRCMGRRGRGRGRGGRYRRHRGGRRRRRRRRHHRG